MVEADEDLPNQGGSENVNRRNGGESTISARPPVDLAPILLPDSDQYANYISPTATEIRHNIKYAELYRPVLGPRNPFINKEMINKNTFNGAIEEHKIANHVFDEMHITYNNFGYTYNPDLGINLYVGDTKKAQLRDGETINSKYDTEDPIVKRPKRLKSGRDPADVENFLGPWAGYESVAPKPEEIPGKVDGKLAESVTIPNVDTSPSRKEKIENIESSIFHAKCERDYLGRTYLHAQMDIDVDLYAEPGIKDCYIPKTLIHTYTGHNKAVSAIRLFPKTAHLLLSAGTDCKARLWNVYKDRQCLRTFIGHSKGIKDITFNNNGTNFLTASYDKWIKLWDTESGECVSRFTNKRIPYCVKFNPDNDRQNIFLVGCSDKRIYQYDIRTKEVVQEYDQHLGAINTITFVDSNRRFVTTSDDKTLRAWEFDIPVVIKYVAEPSMHSMPAVTLHPKEKWLACQSLDNQIVVYSARDRFRCNRKKVFRGHLVAGYACEVGFSPDGRFISSGDSEGRMWFWDWKTCRVLKKFKAHDKVVIGHVWHPHETSKVFTCSWDGTIKLWD